MIEYLDLNTGLQRRLAITMKHDSGREFRWTGVSGVSIGSVRNGLHLMHESVGEDLPLSFVSKPVVSDEGKSGIRYGDGGWRKSWHELVESKTSNHLWPLSSYAVSCKWWCRGTALCTTRSC